MKFKLENLPEGVILCDILKALTAKEAAQIITGIQKVLSNGKARIVIRFTDESAKGEGGAVFLEKSLRPMRILAKKMRGDLLFVHPNPENEKLFDAYSTLDLALAALFGRGESVAGKDRSDLIKELDAAKTELERTKQENTFLQEKVNELLNLVRKPSTDTELKSAVEHYKTLAAEAELEKKGK